MTDNSGAEENSDIGSGDAGNAGGEPADGEPAEIGSADETDALLSRLRLIEDQPLEQRAAAFGQVHSALQSALEGGEAPRTHA